jgi:hypothetical protein
MNNAVQAIGNKHEARTVTDPAFFSAKESMEEKFKAVLVLKPHASLFQWTSVSNIPAGLLDDAIKNMSKNAQQLQHPPSSDDISTLTKACRSFKAAQAAYSNAKRNENVCKKIRFCMGMLLSCLFCHHALTFAWICLMLCTGLQYMLASSLETLGVVQR